MRRRHVVALLLFVALTAGLTLSNTLVAQNEDIVGSDRLKALKQEYINTLQSRVDAVESRYKVGTSPLPQVVSARIDLLDAELRVCHNARRTCRDTEAKSGESPGEGELCQGSTQDRIAGFHSGGCTVGNGRTAASRDSLSA